MAEELSPMKQLNIADKNGVQHQFEIKDAKARNDIDSAKELGFDSTQFNITETQNQVSISISANNANQNNFLKGDGTWFDLDGKKQDVLSAGDGIDITNDVVSHSIKIIENDSEEDTIENAQLTVYLKNNHYKIITFDNTIAVIKFMIEKSDEGILQETGFEFKCPENTELETLYFEVIDDAEKKIYTTIPTKYKSRNVYQGTIVNYKCTIGEYEGNE